MANSNCRESYRRVPPLPPGMFKNHRGDWLRVGRFHPREAGEPGAGRRKNKVWLQGHEVGRQPGPKVWEAGREERGKRQLENETSRWKSGWLGQREPAGPGGSEVCTRHLVGIMSRGLGREGTSVPGAHGCRA